MPRRLDKTETRRQLGREEICGEVAARLTTRAAGPSDAGPDIAAPP